MRKVKTDRVDALRIAAFTLDRWLELRKYEPADIVRKTLKVMNRQCLNLNRILVMQKNNLISLLDSVFPGANNLFTSPCRETDGHEKWVDFVLKLCDIFACLSSDSPTNQLTANTSKLSASIEID